MKFNNYPNLCVLQLGETEAEVAQDGDAVPEAVAVVMAGYEGVILFRAAKIAAIACARFST
jgi:hypothetical protein